MYLTKIKIARFLVVFGFLLNLSNYAVELFDFYNGDATSIAYTLDDSEEKSESKEKESSENEDIKEKDKISQYSDDKIYNLSDLVFKGFPELYLRNTSVYLEYSTPPPKYG